MTPPGQVFTPPWLAARLWEVAARFGAPDPGSTWRVLEPSAGTGRLVQAGLAWADTNRQPLAIDALELDPALAPTLQGLDPARVRVRGVDTLDLLAAPDPMAALRGPWDAVIANPPWLRETGHAATFRAIRNAHPRMAQLYAKDADLHHFFWLTALEGLRPGGIAVMLTPAYVLHTRSATALRRRLVNEGRVLGIWRSGAREVFADAHVECAVTVWQRGASGPDGQGAQGGGPQQAADLDETLTPASGLPWVLPADGGAWKQTPALADGVADLLAGAPTLGDWFRAVEGVSTGADRVADPGSAGGRSGVFVLTAAEVEALHLTDGERASFLRRRAGATARAEWVLVIRDGALPHLDTGEGPRSPLEQHLTQHRRLLEARAEMRRNARRSWYAATWPRSESWRPGAIVTPKWSARPAFRLLGDDEVPLTDHRVLVPLPGVTPPDPAQVVAALNALDGATLGRLLGRKGAVWEFYGPALLTLPVR